MKKRNLPVNSFAHVTALLSQYHRLVREVKVRYFTEQISGETYYRYLYMIRKAYERMTGAVIKRSPSIDPIYFVPVQTEPPIHDEEQIASLQTYMP